MPTKTSERWIDDGDNVKSRLEKLGYKVDLQYAKNDIPTQVNQIENQLTKGAKAPDHRLDRRHRADHASCRRRRTRTIKVIAYDRLISNTPERRLLRHLRQLQGRRPAGDLAADRPGPGSEDGTDGDGKGPFNIELFAGCPDDNNATFFFNGAMDDPQALHRQGHPGRQERPDRLQDRRDPALGPGTAQKRMEDLLTKTYAGGAKLDGVLSPYDGLSIGILSALKSTGYGTAGQPYPIVTGQDAEVPR